MSVYLTPANTAYPQGDTLPGKAPDGTYLASPAGGTAGVVTLNGATAVTVAAPKITANSQVVFTLNTIGAGTPSAAFVATKTAGTGFSVAAGAGNTCIYNWMILEPAVI